MTITTLETLTRKMRAWQKWYSESRSQSALTKKNKYECMVDAELDRISDERERVVDSAEQRALGAFFERE